MRGLIIPFPKEKRILIPKGIMIKKEKAIPVRNKKGKNINKVLTIFLSFSVNPGDRKR